MSGPVSGDVSYLPDAPGTLNYNTISFIGSHHSPKLIPNYCVTLCSFHLFAWIYLILVSLSVLEPILCLFQQAKWLGCEIGWNKGNRCTATGRFTTNFGDNGELMGDCVTLQYLVKKEVNWREQLATHRGVIDERKKLEIYLSTT